MRCHSLLLHSLLLISYAMLVGDAAAQAAVINPAARTHVKIIDGAGVKYTSRLSHVVELNFTFNFHHQDGKPIITQSLERVAKNYAIGGAAAFTLRKITSGAGGTEKAAPPFTLADLLAGEVIVANNISSFNSSSFGGDKRAAIETAIKTEGMGYLGIHGSGDGGSGWAFYSEELHPLDYKSIGTRTSGPVYKHLATAKHIVTENILETGTTTATVPNGTDATGREILTDGVKTRMMLNEWYKFGRNLLTDAKYRPLTTPLLKFDARNLSVSSLDPVYRFAGGNVYAFLLKIGNGIGSYLQAGHQNDEIMRPGTSFDGGTGDFDRYLAQNLFFLAGYKTEPCAGTHCDGLPIVDADNMLTGLAYPGTSTALLETGSPAFTSFSDEKYVASLFDVRGRVVATKSGSGKVKHEFDPAGLKSGLYFLRVKIGSAASLTERYAVTGSAR